MAKLEKKILIVEDSPLSRMFIKKELSDLPCQFLYAETGKEALALLESEENILCVTLDAVLPDMNGMDILERVREKEDEDSDSPEFIMITGNDSEEVRNRGFELGVINFFQKPFEPGTI